MEKIFEALERLKDMLIGNGVNNNINDYVDNLISPIKQALLELKEIKEAKPSEAMECLENAGEFCLEKFGAQIEDYKYFRTLTDEQFKTIKQALLKAKEYEQAFNTINEKRVDIKLLHWAYPNVEAYNVKVREQKDYWWREELTPEEFEFIGRLAGAK